MSVLHSNEVGEVAIYRVIHTAKLIEQLTSFPEVISRSNVGAPD